MRSDLVLAFASSAQIASAPRIDRPVAGLVLKRDRVNEIMQDGRIDVMDLID